MKTTQDRAALQGADNLQRPPYERSLHTTTKPLIVTPTLVSRADATSWAERPHDDGSAVDRSGREVEHPASHPGELAIEAEPNLAFERWDEYWRKVHGPKFAYEEPGSSSQLVLRYDQLHRVPSGPSSSFRPPYRAMVNGEGKLVSDPQARVPAYRRPRWDGLAYIAYASQQDLEKTLGQEQYAERIIADEHVAFRVVTRQICEEYILIPSAQHREAISLVKIHKRIEGLSREEFRERMLRGHAEFVMARTATHNLVRRYAQLHNLGSTQPDPEGSTIDSLSIFGFASLNDVEDFLVSPEYALVEQDEQRLCAADGEFWTAVNYNVINRLTPELATELP